LCNAVVSPIGASDDESCHERRHVARGGDVPAIDQAALAAGAIGAASGTGVRGYCAMSIRP
jgi:hypothetical protein